MDANKRNKLEWTDEVPATVGRQPEGNKAGANETVVNWERSGAAGDRRAAGGAGAAASADL